ncbi:MAG TPA: amino acid ABC transporter permease [Stellaceae bacterium]|nr:amino acid ABC transporter permease [Stellaceae bacterium]
MIWRWVRANLVNGPLNTLLTLLILGGVAWVLPPLFRWAILKAEFTAPDAQACLRAGGACWAFVREWYRFILFGRFPYDQQWRPALSVAIFVALFCVSATRRLSPRPLAVVWLASLAAIGVLMWGGVFGLSFVETDLWNGLPLTLILATLAILLAFPLALLLALARRSTLPAIKAIAVLYIETVRGLPFITILFMAAVLFPLFLPPGVAVPKLWRIVAALTLFIAAYLAEALRGGLQAIPRGQDEAASSLGLGYWRKMRLVILPQALAIAIPPLVNTFIGAFKDTALVGIVGLFDILRDVGIGTNDPHWRGAYIEAYLMVGAIYFTFCYFLSRYARHLERDLRKGR